jgi:hypothetical protein
MMTKLSGLHRLHVYSTPTASHFSKRLRFCSNHRADVRGRDLRGNYIHGGRLVPLMKQVKFERLPDSAPTLTSASDDFFDKASWLRVPQIEACQGIHIPFGQLCRRRAGKRDNVNSG